MRLKNVLPHNKRRTLLLPARAPRAGPAPLQGMEFNVSTAPPAASSREAQSSDLIEILVAGGRLELPTSGL